MYQPSLTASAGNCIIESDFSQVELCTLAQLAINLLGMHGMADKINRGVDLHCELGAEIDGCTYEDILARCDSDIAAIRDPAKNTRNCAKPVNFGGPGGMQAETMTFYAKQGYGVIRPKAEWVRIIKLWGKTTPEGPEYLRYVKSSYKRNQDGLYELTLPGTSIVRRGATFCAAANCGFQTLGTAVMPGRVGWLLTKECFTGRKPDGTPSPLRYFRPWNYVHDSFMGTCPIEARTEVSQRLETVMIEGAQPFLPDVTVRCETVAMTRWSKSAKSKMVNGELSLWTG